MQEVKGEERIAAKSKPMNLVATSMAEPSTAPSSTASTISGSLRANSHGLGLIAGTGRPIAEDSNESDAARSSQSWQEDVRSSASAESPADMNTS